MGTIMKREKKDGSQSYTAIIRKKKKGKVVLTMTETFMSEQSAKRWVKKREGDLKTKGAVDKIIHLKKRKTWSDVIADYCEASPNTFGKTKAANLAYLQRLDFGKISVEDTDAHTFFSLAKDLLIGVQAPPSDSRNDSPVKWSGKTGQRAKMYPTLKTGYTNDEETQFFRQV